MSKNLDEIIGRLGYADSSCLLYEHDNFIRSDFDAASLTDHTKKVLKELSPYAVYMMNGDPFVAFFNEPADQETKKHINRNWPTASPA